MTKWEEEVKKDYDEIVKKNNLYNLNFSSWKTSLFLAFTFIAIAIGIFAIANYFYIRHGFIPIVRPSKENVWWWNFQKLRKRQK